MAGLPTLTRAVPGVIGVAGVPVSGELFPPYRANTTVVTGGAQHVESSPSQKRSLFGKGVTNASGVRVAISNPVLQDIDGKNPLSKIATVDLAAAAKAERERRERRRRDSGLVQTQRPPLSPKENMKRAVSLKRKEVASVASHMSSFPGTLHPDYVASTTSAQLSPGVEEIRRRSPRQAMIPEQPIQQQVEDLPVMFAPEPEEEIMKPRSASPPREAFQAIATTFPQQPVPKLDIRPSRRLPPSPKSAQAEPPLQRRPTIGLPSNPRARGTKLAQEDEAHKLQTVMFVNSIVYDDPQFVQTLMDDAGNRTSKTTPDPVAAAPERVKSVVNRPRPIPRKVADPNPQASPSLNHRRSKSGGSLAVRKSVFASTAGSPTQLPPLPPPPKSVGAAAQLRPQPNDTKSMTFDEKMTLLFPSPPSGNAVKRRSSSVPELPPIPVSYLDMASTASPGESSERRRSNRTTKTSIKTESILDVDEIPRKRPEPSRRLSRPDISDETGDTWLPKESAVENKGRVNNSTAASGGELEQAKRASSPVLPPARSAWTDSTYTRTYDDATTTRDSVRSAEIAVGIAVNMRQVALGGSGQTHQQNSPMESGNISAVSPGGASQSQWHRRVGDQCPTFSDRPEKVHSGRMPPPTPLHLSSAGRKNTVVIQAEPSPLESPEHALQQIQEQLKMYEAPSNRDSVESQKRRLELLENLEKEMGLQENHWQEMKHDMGRDSLNSLQTASPADRNSRTLESVKVSNEPSVRSSIGADRRASRRAQMQNNVNLKAASRISTASSSFESPVSSKMSVWQKRLTEAQLEYMENAAERLRHPSVNLLPVPVNLSHMGSPTPPESDHSDTEESPVLETAVSTLKKLASLWTPPKEKAVTQNHLWTAVVNSPDGPEFELPGVGVRLPSRKDMAPLTIQSSELWRKPYVNTTRSATGLWKPSWASAAPPADPSRLSYQSGQQQQTQKPPRPVTQRPPRRNRRVTLLPDIIENPEPLPDKGTLGIFQFPWGEKSDTASLRPSGMFMAMPGTMASGGPSAIAAANAVTKQQQKQQGETDEYSSSFFDDYDDDDDIVVPDSDNEESSEGEEDDDGFDETTLWEIASLLKSDEIPSKNSLFFRPVSPGSGSGSVMGDYMDELPSDGELNEGTSQSIMIGLAEEPRALAFGMKKTVVKEAVVESSTLWTIDDEASETDREVVEVVDSEDEEKKTPAGLWTPPVVPKEDASKPSLFTVNSGRTEFRTTSQEPAALLLTRKLRPTEQKPLEKLTSKRLWTKPVKHVSEGLWTPPPVSEEYETTGLFSANTRRSEYRTTSKEPAALQLENRKPRQVKADNRKSMVQITSTDLWKAGACADKAQRNWITAAKKSKNNNSHRVLSTPENWEVSLKEAISASRYWRGATAVEWDAALQKAMSLSYPATPSFDAATRHPVFAGSSLVTRSEWFHPAATGYTYDTAIVHPVFFGSLDVTTCPENEIHPAMSAYAAKKLRKMQRSKSVSSSSKGHHERSDSGVSVSSSHGHSRSRSRSSSKRKEEILAQIRALEEAESLPLGKVEEVQEQEPEPVLLKPIAFVPPPVPPVPAEKMSKRAMIQAQIEALEQEKMFAQQVAQEAYYRRRESQWEQQQQVAQEEVAQEQVKEKENVNGNGGVRTLQALQGYLESQAMLRQSMYGEIPTPVSRTSSSASRSKSTSVKSSKSKTKKVVGPAPSLWKAPRSSSPQQDASGLWTATANHRNGTSLVPQEDTVAAAMRERRRKTRMKLARRAEILARIRAIESGQGDLFSASGNDGKVELWTPRKMIEHARIRRDWLEESKIQGVFGGRVSRSSRSSKVGRSESKSKRTTRGVELRY